MSKLHEVLAVEGDLEANAKKIMDESRATFGKRTEHFMEATKTLTMFDDARSNENATEHKAMVTTIMDRLAYNNKAVAKYLNVFISKEATNQAAKAELTVGSKSFGELPATALLGLENRLKTLRSVYEAIPTLAPGIIWDRDETAGDGIYVAREPEERFKTEKQVTHKVLYDATPEHPAQIESWTQDTPVGKFEVQHRSGMLSPADKAGMLGRIDTLIRAVKKARQRANTAEVIRHDIADDLLNFING